MSNTVQTIQARTTNTAGLMATPAVDLTPTDREQADNEARIACLAAGLYIANIAYKAALESTKVAESLDNMCNALPEIMTEITANVPKAFKVTSANVEFAETLRGYIADRLWAFTAVEYARIEAGDGYGYLFDLLADNLKGGADPRTVRTTALAAPKRIRDLNEAACA